MFVLTKVSPKFAPHDPSATHLEVIGSGDTVDQAIQLYRDHMLMCNNIVIELATKMTVPTCIVELAKHNIDRNASMLIELNKDGVVFVNGDGPEMDYFTITESSEQK